jgi:hypothetical protein
MLPDRFMSNLLPGSHFFLGFAAAAANKVILYFPLLVLILIATDIA